MIKIRKGKYSAEKLGKCEKPRIKHCESGAWVEVITTGKKVIVGMRLGGKLSTLHMCRYSDDGSNTGLICFLDRESLVNVLEKPSRQITEHDGGGGFDPLQGAEE